MSASYQGKRTATIMVLNLIGTDKCCIRKCNGNEHFQMLIYDESQELIHVFGRQSRRSFRGIFQVKISSKLFSHLSNFNLVYASGINMNVGFCSLKTQNCASFRTCACVCVHVHVLERDRDK